MYGAYHPQYNVDAPSISGKCITQQEQACGLIAGRRVYMLVESAPYPNDIVCYACGKVGQYKSNYAVPAKKKNRQSSGRPSKSRKPGETRVNSKKNWCSPHATTSHNDIVWYVQAGRPTSRKKATCVPLLSSAPSPVLPAITRRRGPQLQRPLS